MMKNISQQMLKMYINNCLRCNYRDYRKTTTHSEGCIIYYLYIYYIIII